jgi:hypothetical protein
VERTASLLTRRKGKATLLCFDGYEHTEPQHKHWVSLFLEHAFLVSWLRCVVAGRQVPDPRPHPWGVAAGQVTCDPLAEPDAFKDHFAARGRKLPPKKVEQLFQFLRLQRDAGFDVANPVTALAMLEKMATP